MQTSVARRARTSILSAAALLAAIASPALALHRETPGAVPLGPEEHSPGRSWSRYFAFSSTSDLTGSGATGRQIYVFNHFNWVCQRSLDLIEPATAATCPNPPEPFLVQVTNGIGSPDHPSVTELFATNAAPPELPLAQ